VRRLTKTLARQEARRHMRLGHFVPKRPELPWVHCPRPECRAKVTADPLAWEKPSPLLEARLVDHLLEEHPTLEENP
jgi:hypothetical protein